MEDGLDPRFAQPRTLFFGIGAQKSATSWLHKQLRDHPEVCLPVRKEQHYWTTRRLPQPFARQLWVQAQLRRIEARGLYARLTRTRRGRATDEAWRRTEAMLRHEAEGHAAYADVLFQNYSGQPVLGEITPEYALLEPADFAEMARLGPDVRFVFIMRDPVGRLHSGVRQMLRKTRGVEAVTPDNVAGLMREALGDPEHPAMVRSRYDVTVEKLEAAAPRDRVCYLFYETMFRQAEMDRLTGFLGIAPRPARVDERVHIGAGGDIGAPSELLDAAARVLAPVYDFVEARFGATTPDAWRRARAGAEPAPALGT